MRERSWAEDIFLTVLFIVLFCVWCYMRVNGQEKPVTLELTPTKCDAPCTVKGKTKVVYHKDNYRLVVMWANVHDHANNSEAGTKALVLSQEEMGFDFELTLPKGCFYVMALLYRKPKGTPFETVDAYISVGGNDGCVTDVPP